MIHYKSGMVLPDFSGLRYLVVGCGFFGAVIAERIAADKRARVVLLEKRNHVGGNSYSETDRDSGIEYHVYGSHIFHTQSQAVWNYINRHCAFNSYRHKVLATFGERVYTMPINLSTINSVYGANFSPQEAEAFIRSEIEEECILDPSNLEYKAISLVGRRLYEALIRGYTVKQWGMDPKELPADIITRLPVRYNYKTDYFDDPWQGIPVEGYKKVFENLLNHRNIDVFLGVDFFDVRHLLPPSCLVIYTGPVDRYFDYKYGRLNWRTLRFEKEVVPVRDFQGTTVMNYTEESVSYTRIHEFRYYHEEREYNGDSTFIMREYPAALKDGEDPYYPVNCEQDKEMICLYEAETRKCPNLILGGRQGTYRYINMDEAILSALEIYDRGIRTRKEDCS